MTIKKMLEIGLISNPLLYMWMRKNYDLIHPIESERRVNKCWGRIAFCFVVVSVTIYFLIEMEILSTAIFSLTGVYVFFNSQIYTTMTATGYSSATA
jgi:hypothetical protein